MGIFAKPEKTEAQTRYEALVDYSIKVKQGTEARILSLFNQMWTLPAERPENITDEDWAKQQADCMAADQAVLDLYGSDATQLFIWHSKAQELLAMDPEYIVLTPPYNYQPNEGYELD